MKTNWVFVLPFFFFFSFSKVILKFKWDQIWGNLTAGFKADDHTGFTLLLTYEFMYLWKAPSIKLFFPELYRRSSTIAKNPCPPQNLLGHRSTIERRVGTGLGSPRGDPAPPAHHSCGHGEPVPSPGRHPLLWSLPSLFFESVWKQILRDFQISVPKYPPFMHMK